MKHAYIYYRIDPVQADLAASRIDALLSLMAPHCSQPPRRMNRCDDPATWMEIYEGIAGFGAFEECLAAALATLHCSDFTVGERHMECFSAPTPAA